MGKPSFLAIWFIFKFIVVGILLSSRVAARPLPPDVDDVVSTSVDRMFPDQELTVNTKGMPCDSFRRFDFDDVDGVSDIDDEVSTTYASTDIDCVHVRRLGGTERTDDYGPSHTGSTHHATGEPIVGRRAEGH